MGNQERRQGVRSGIKKNARGSVCVGGIVISLAALPNARFFYVKRVATTRFFTTTLPKWRAFCSPPPARRRVKGHVLREATEMAHRSDGLGAPVTAMCVL